MIEKILGYLLLFCGVGIILFTAFNMYQILTQQAQPVQLFQFPGISLDMAQSLPGGLPPQIAEQLGSQQLKQEIIPADMLNGPTNLFAHLFIMGFFASIGGKLAQIGTYLLRPIVVKVREEKISSSSKE